MPDLTLSFVPDQRAEPAELVLEYRLDEPVPLDLPAGRRHVERWAVSVLVDAPAPDEGRAEIGDAALLVFNLEPGADIRDLADRASGTWIDVDTRSALPEIEGESHGRASHVLLLERVWLHPAYRGSGLGPIVAAAAIERLGRGCDVAACYPAPFDDPCQPPADRDRSVEALGRLWSKVGFRHWHDGVWMLDLHTNDMHAVLTDLLAARSGRETASNVPGHMGLSGP